MKKVLLSLCLGLLVAQNASAVPSCGQSLMPAFTANQATQLCKTFGSAVSQSLIPSADNTYDLGSATYEWKDIYLAGNLIDPTITKGLILGNTSVPAAITTAAGTKPAIYTARTTGIAGAFYQEYGANSAGALVGYAKTRAATAAGGTIVQKDDVVGQTTYYGDNGTTYDTAAQIKVTIDGTPGATTDMPGAMEFLVSANGSATLVRALKLTEAKDWLYGSTTGLNISASTADAADSSGALLNGGGANGSSRGASFEAYGNEYASLTGSAVMKAGNVSGGNAIIATGGVNQLVITNAGVTTLTNDLGFATNKTISLQEATAGTACSGTLTANGATPVVTSTSCALTGSRIFLQRTSAETGVVNAWVSAISTGVSFSITGEAGDTGTYDWFIIHEAP